MTKRTQEWIGTAIAWLLFIPMLMGALLVMGQAIDARDHWIQERHRCLKEATNGLQIEECKR